MKIQSKIMAPAPWQDDRPAPNGAPVHENFANWFADSKVVDTMGRPLRVYHGTADDFASFDPAKVGSRHVDTEAGDAFYFTDDISTANWYAQSAGEQSGCGAHVRPVYLSMRNPLVVDFQGEGLEYLGEEITKAKRLGHDGLVAHNYNDGCIATHYVAFRPEQIKSAIGNSGLFAANSPLLTDNAGVRLAQKARSVAATRLTKAKALQP